MISQMIVPARADEDSDLNSIPNLIQVSNESPELTGLRKTPGLLGKMDFENAFTNTWSPGGLLVPVPVSISLPNYQNRTSFGLIYEWRVSPPLSFHLSN